MYKCAKCEKPTEDCFEVEDTVLCEVCRVGYDRLLKIRALPIQRQTLVDFIYGVYP